MKLRNRDKKAFPQHSGTILQWCSSAYKDSKIFYVKVAMMDYEIGYTLVGAEDSQDNFACIHGPSSPKKAPVWISIDVYNAEYKYLLDCIRQKKIFNVDEMCGKSGRYYRGGGCHMVSCAFI